MSSGTPPAGSASPYPAAFVILTGGIGSRLGGVDKAGLELAGATLLDRALAACGDSIVIVAGPSSGNSGLAPRVRWVTETPAHGGPAAGLAAGIAALSADLVDPGALVGVWAVDQVGVTRQTWLRLAAACRDDGGAVLTNGGRRQYGVGVFPLTALVGARAARASWHGASLRSLVDPLVGVEMPGSTSEARDIDTLDDLEWWRRRTGAAATGPRTKGQ